MRLDQFVVHVSGVAGRVAQPRDAGNLRQPGQQPAETPLPAVRSFAVPGVDVLAKQRHFAHPGLGELFRLRHDLRHRPRHFRTTRIRHHAEGAELVAALLHGEKGGHAPPDDLGAARLRQVLELVLEGVVRLDDLLAVLGLSQRFGQAVIGLRPDHQVDRALAADDLRSLRLGHTAGDADHRLQPARSPLGLQVANASKLGIDLLGSLLSDVAGVEQDEVGVLDTIGAGIAVRRQRIRHALAVIDVHLAAIGLDEDLFRRRRQGHIAFRSVGDPCPLDLFQFHGRLLAAIPGKVEIGFPAGIAATNSGPVVRASGQRLG